MFVSIVHVCFSGHSGSTGVFPHNITTSDNISHNDTTANDFPHANRTCDKSHVTIICDNNAVWFRGSKYVFRLRPNVELPI